MKIAEKNAAIELRKQGLTFSEIQREISVSKSSLSYWLREIKLAPEQVARIAYKNTKIKEKFINFNELRKEESEKNKRNIFDEAVKEIECLSKESLKLIGIALYWAEGCKSSCWETVSFSNSDPEMIRLMMKWFRLICNVPDNKFRIKLQLYDKDEVEKSKNYWSEITGIPLTQFSKPYLRISPTSRRKMVPSFCNGTCHIRISDIRLLTKIRGWIKGLNGAIV